MNQSFTKTIYVAGPIGAATRNGITMNIEIALEHASLLIERGWSPFVPHLFVFLDRWIRDEGGIPPTYQDWMAIDEAWLRRCDAFFRIGPSPGTNQEAELAARLGLPLYHRIDDVPNLRSGLTEALAQD